MSYLKGKSVLVVDDEPTIRELFVNELTSHGCICKEADCGEKAIEIFKQNHFDAVVSDIRMPNGDGLFLLKKIVEQGETNCLLVFITGYSDIHIKEFYERGADLVVQKPFEVDIIVKMIEDSLQAPRSQWRQMMRIISIMNIEVNWQGLAQPMSTMTLNLSRIGMFVQTSYHFPDVNEKIDFKVEVKTPFGLRSFNGKGVCRWVRFESTYERPAGFGVEFVDPDAKEIDELSDLAGLNYLFKS